VELLQGNGSLNIMNATWQLHDLGQSLWLDNITRALLASGTLKGYIKDCAITGLTSNPTIFERAIESGRDYDEAIRALATVSRSSEAVFFELALDDLTRAADLLRPIHDATDGMDGWVSLEISPLLADDAAATIAGAVDLHARARRPNIFIKIPGTSAGIAAIEEAIFAGVPVNITLLFSREQYLAAAAAYMRGIERRLAARISPDVASVASIFVSRWDAAVNSEVREPLRNCLGIAVAARAYSAYRELLASARWQKLAAAGAPPQRLLWASTGVKDPSASDTLYMEALAAPDTINTVPEKTLLAFAQHGKVKHTLQVDDGDAEATLEQFAREGVDVEALAVRLQREGTSAFEKSWHELIRRIESKRDTPPFAATA